MAEYPRDWMDQAACRNAPDPDTLFFPDQGAHTAAAQAKAICATCPVIPQCAAYVASHGATHGIWAGTSPKQRRPTYTPPTPKPRPTPPPRPTCTYPGCTHPTKARKLCNGHYLQHRRGRPLTPIRPRKNPA